MDPLAYRERLRRVERRMEQEGLDALLVVDPANMCYLSGYDGWSFYVPQALLVVGGEAEPYWIGRPMDAAGARYTTWLSDDHIETYPEEYVQSPDHHPMEAVASLLARLGLSHRTVGVEMDTYALSAHAFRVLREALPSTRFRDASLLVNWVRAVKEPEEIALLRKAAAVAAKAMQAALDAVAVGRREWEAAAEVARAEIWGTDDAPGDVPAFPPLLASNERAAAAHLTFAERRYVAGDAVNVELAGCHRRYHAPLARTICLGAPPPRLRELASVVEEGFGAALEALRPGVTAEEVEAAWRRVVNSRGYEKPSRLGYSVGLGYPPDWGEHTISLRPRDETVLLPGMTFHVIAGMWLDGYGFERSETVLVTEAGHEVLTRFPGGLLVKER